MSVPEDLPGKIKTPGHDLVIWYEVGVPIYKVAVKATVQRPTELGVLQEYVLKMIASGVRSDTTIGDHLGLDPQYISTALTSLNNGQYVVSVSGADGKRLFTSTDKGYEVLERTHASLSSDTFEFLVEGVTGGFRAKHAVHWVTWKDLKAAGITTYLQVEDAYRPSVKMLNDNHAKIVPIYKEWREAATLAPAELIEIDDLADQYLTYGMLNVLVFRCRETGRILLRSFEGYAEREDYGTLLTQKERTLGGVVPAQYMVQSAEVEQSIILHKVNLDAHKAIEAEQEAMGTVDFVEESIAVGTTMPPLTAKSERIAELERQLAASSGRPIYNYEHRQVLEEAIMTTQHSLFIISPWIKRVATDDHLLNLMRAALERGVNLAIGYGMPSRQGDMDDYIDPDVEAAFTKLQKRRYKGSLHLERLAGTHEKIIVSDSAYCVVTSFNWLSYKGNRGFRNETGILTTDPKVVRQIKSEVEGRFRNLPAGGFV